jgi:hypothetical protein
MTPPKNGNADKPWVLMPDQTINKDNDSNNNNNNNELRSSSLVRFFLLSLLFFFTEYTSVYELSKAQ